MAAAGLLRYEHRFYPWVGWAIKQVRSPELPHSGSLSDLRYPATAPRSRRAATGPAGCPRPANPDTPVSAVASSRAGTSSYSIPRATSPHCLSFFIPHTSAYIFLRSSLMVPRCFVWVEYQVLGCLPLGPAGRRLISTSHECDLHARSHSLISSRTAT